MAYIRTIKASFFTSDDIVSLSPLARLLYVGLWTESDREGRLTWRPGNFKLRILPGDNCDIIGLCNELVDAGLVVPYQIDGKSYAEIPTFKTHQHINAKERQSLLPARVADESVTGELRDNVTSQRDAGAITSRADEKHGCHKERKEKREEGKSPSQPEEVIKTLGIAAAENLGNGGSDEF